MALKHAVLAALLDGPATGYELTKWFAAGVANFWPATKPQLYAELARLEGDGLVAGAEVVQRDRPNKRVMTITDAGIDALDDFAREASKPIATKSDLIVKVRSLDVVDPAALRDDLLAGLVRATDRLHDFAATEARMLKGREHDEYLRTARRVGPYLTLRAGLARERAYVAWLREVLDVLDLRVAATAPDPPHRRAAP